jgi:N-acyl amino acid synthase FeeM
MLLDASAPSRRVEDDVSRRLYTIRAADSDGHRSSAHILVNRMYAWRGYVTSQHPEDLRNSNRITLIATDHDMTVGTITIGFDGAHGLLVDELFRDEARLLREDKASLCEFTKLAVDGAVRSKRVLASLFHVAFIHAHEVKGCDRILIEVNPRHVRYYERMLGFEVKGRERHNPRVSAPAVLLSLELSHAREQINRFGGRADLVRDERSLYPYFFSASEEAGIIHRLQ